MMGANEKVIECFNINKLYKNNVIAVNNVSFSFKTGTFYSIMGHSGSGKTTLIQMLGLLNENTGGELMINNINTKKLNTLQKADMRRDVFGFVFQSYFLNKNMKAFENVMIPMLINSAIKKKKERAISLLEQFGLSNRIDHYPNELSGGEQQRVAISRALANEPLCILADEPTGNLDKENELIVLNYLKKCSTDFGKCVIVVSHNDIVRNYSDVVITMDNGKFIKVDGKND